MTEDKIFKFAYDMAFRDATMRKAFPKLDDEKTVENGEELFYRRKKRVKDNAEAFVEAYINAILSGFFPCPYDTIIEVCNAARSDGFTFGNVQKLVNMIAKYMFFKAYGDEREREKFRNCHCPMDGIMIRKVKEYYKDFDTNFSWSTLILDNKGLQRYKQFQDCIKEIGIKENAMPIEVDFLLWDE